MTMKTTTKTLLLMAVLSCCVQVAWGQTEKMLELINSRGSYFPLMLWLEDESHAEGYIKQLHDFSLQSMRKTLEAVQEERKDAQTILIAREEILGAKLVSKLDSKPKQKDLDKQDEILKERFNEVDRLKKTFDKAKTTDRLCAMLESAINSELNTRQPATMPGGSLKRFEYSTGNGYSGFHLEIFLGKKEGANVLRVEEKRMRFEPDEKEPVVYDVVVDDSVFVKVRDMVEKGQIRVRTDFSFEEKALGTVTRLAGYAVRALIIVALLVGSCLLCTTSAVSADGTTFATILRVVGLVGLAVSIFFAWRLYRNMKKGK